MDKKADFFQKKLSNTRSFTRQKKTSHAWIWVIIIMLFLLGGAFAYRKLFWAPANTEVEEYTNFSLGEEIHLEGEIRANGDITTYSYTIDDTTYGEMKIRSDSESINLYDYVGGFVELTGIVEKFYQGEPIIKVYALSGTISGKEKGDTDIVLDDNSGVYILGAGIQFLPDFFDEYVLLNEGENGEIHIQNVETEKEIVLNYFRCNSSDPSRNCKGLIESFENNHTQDFITSEHDHYYRQSENQWFVANGNRWGIFINDVSEDEIYKLKDLIKFANEKNMNEWIKSRAMRICQGSGEKLQKINNSEITLKQEGLIVSVSGDGIEKQMTCQILVDFSLPAKGQLQTLIIGDAVVVSEEPEEEKSEETSQENTENSESSENNQISAIAFDTNVPQFPIKEEGLAYKSARGGYILKFPSSNISYSVSSVKENFGRSDVNCSYVINVIKYSDKENLEVSPAIRIYECDGSVQESWGQGIVVYPRLDKKFVVQMNDGSRNDFSMNLKFEELTEE